MPPIDRSNHEVRYTKDHEWVRMDGDIATIGITDHAQEQLGDIVFIELPEVGRDVDRDEACAVVESVKAASDVFSPLAGKIAERNETVVEDPALVNGDAQGEAWLFRVEVAEPAEYEELMDEAAYNEYLENME
jgi:glycine cleavage system H protein